MTITCLIQGAPGGDNSLFVRIDSGQAVERLLFDAGEGCVAGLSLSEIQSIGHLFFSHLHMDHVAGFDSFFRATYTRTERPNVIWGPAGSAGILQCRFRGFLWNLHHGAQGCWRVREVLPNRIETSRFELGEAFALRHREPDETRPGEVILDAADYTVAALQMEHLTPSLAYIVREKPRLHLRAERLAELGLSPGPWIRELKAAGAEAERLTIGGREYAVQELREALLTETRGDSIAYLTDFLLDETALERLVPALEGCTTIVCESQYRHADWELAQRHCHMTSVQAADLARRAGAGELVLIHVSDRYRAGEWREMLEEARAVFPNTRFPEQWELKDGT